MWGTDVSADCHLLKPDNMSPHMLTALQCQSDDQLETCGRKCAWVFAYVFNYLENTSFFVLPLHTFEQTAILNVMSCYVISGGIRIFIFSLVL